MDEDNEVRDEATEALGFLDWMGWERSEAAKRAVPAFVAALKSGAYEVRGAAARALGQIGDVRAVEPLMVALRDEENVASWRLNDEAAWALGRIGVVALDPLIGALKDKAGGVRAVEPLIMALKDSDARSSAARALGSIGDARAVEPLIGALKDKSDSVRMAAAEALGKFADARALEPLIAALKDLELEVRRAAGVALGHIRDARAVEPLLVALKDESSKVRLAAVEALGQIGDTRAVEPLVGAVKDKD